MSPPISKEWWLAAALTSGSVPAALGQPAAAPQERQVGVVTTVKPGAAGQPGTLNYAPLVTNGTRDLPITNNTDAPMHVMFTDQSSITLGPKSAMVVKLYEHDAQKKSGNVVIELAQGLMRYVGGQISKRSGAQIRTATATIGIRGGIGMFGPQGAFFLFGQQMQGTDNSGNTQTINRPGFGFGFSNGVMGPAQRSDINQLNGFLTSLGLPPATQLQPSGPPATGRTIFDRFNVAGNTNNLYSTNQNNTFTNPNTGGAGGSKNLRDTSGGSNPTQS